MQIIATIATCISTIIALIMLFLQISHLSKGKNLPSENPLDNEIRINISNANRPMFSRLFLVFVVFSMASGLYLLISKLLVAEPVTQSVVAWITISCVVIGLNVMLVILWFFIRR